MTTGRTISTTTRPDDHHADRVRPRAAALPPSTTALPPSVTARLPGGLWVTAVRLATVARVEMRLTMPLTPGHAPPHSAQTATGPVPAARAAVLAACVLRGTTGTDGTRVETALGRIGGDVVPLVGADRLALRGGVLADGLDDLLRTLADALSRTERPDHEVTAARTVLRGQTALARMSPALAAHALLCRHAPRWAGDPQQPPAPELIAAVTPGQVRELHARLLVPAHARLVLVGDLDPDRAVEAVREAFAGWTSDAARPLVPDPDEGPPHTPAEETPARTVGLHPAVRAGTAQVRLVAARGDEPLTPALR
ncbi:insulinase family protein, partial [Streptomyces sediminimaris]